MNFDLKPLIKPWIMNTGFLLLLIPLFFYLDFEKIFFSGPFGIHYMRQTDSLSFASNYFNNGFQFFKPQLYNLKNIDGRAACEFPITYYITAITYTIFGKQFYLQRLVHLIIAYSGAFALFSLTKNILKDYWYAFIISLTLFTSTVFNYYSFNYLPDIPALGFAFLGWFFIFNYQKNKNKNSLIFSFLFFALSGLIKVTYLINPLAVIVFAAIELLFNKDESFLTYSKKVLIYGAISLLVVFSWNVYMFYYIEKYSSNSFITFAIPIWVLDKNGIRIVWDHLSEYWYNKYLSRSVFHLFYILLIFQIIFYKKAEKKLSFLLLILFAGSLAYFILFFAQFKDHDYYFLAFFPIIFLLMINGLKTLQNIIKNRYAHIIVKLVLSGIVISGINLSKSKLNHRFKKELDIYSHAGLMIEQNLSEINHLGIDRDAKIIVGPDYCQNGALLFLDRSGWNLKPNEINVENILTLKNQGAEYLVLASEDSTIVSTGDSTGTKILSKPGFNIYKLDKD